MKTSIKRLVLYAMLTAILVILNFTPLGYLNIGPLSITFMMIPVVVAAITLGPAGGALLGAVFGVTSFLRCFGLEPFGTMLFSIQPVYTFILCFVPRILMGYLSGLIFQGVRRIDRTQWLSCAVASLSGALLNTLFFVSALLLLFGNDAYVQQTLGDSYIKIISSLVTVNAAIEAGVCLVLGTLVCMGVSKAIRD